MYEEIYSLNLKYMKEFNKYTYCSVKKKIGQRIMNEEFQTDRKLFFH